MAKRWASSPPVQCYTHNNLGWKIHVLDRGSATPRASGVPSNRCSFCLWLFFLTATVHAARITFGSSRWTFKCLGFFFKNKKKSFTLELINIINIERNVFFPPHLYQLQKFLFHSYIFNLIFNLIMNISMNTYLNFYISQK